WLVGGVFALCGAVVYSELAINHPQSGGEYVYLTKAYGPSWGFMSGWVSFFAGFSAPIAAAVLAILGFILIGLLVRSGSWAHFSEPAVRTSTTPIAAQFLVSLLWVMVGYSGWN